MLAVSSATSGKTSASSSASASSGSDACAALVAALAAFWRAFFGRLLRRSRRHRIQRRHGRRCGGRGRRGSRRGGRRRRVLAVAQHHRQLVIVLQVVRASHLCAPDGERQRRGRGDAQPLAHGRKHRGPRGVRRHLQQRELAAEAQAHARHGGGAEGARAMTKLPLLSACNKKARCCDGPRGSSTRGADAADAPSRVRVRADRRCDSSTHR